MVSPLQLHLQILGWSDIAMQQFRPPLGRPSWQGKGEVQVKNPEMLP
jgi:hypothetical protein